MQRLDNLIERLKGIEAKMLETVRAVLEENREVIIDMNSEDQLFERGVNRYNVEISSFAPYSQATVFIKRQKGQVTNRVTLRDEGDFHFSFFVEFTDTGFEIKANDWKTKGLISKYGEGILGLTDDNFKDLAVNYVAPELLKILKTL